MGGHGGLNILPQKRWNVYNFDNREKVRKDEEAAARDEHIRQQQERHKDSEARLAKLRDAALAKHKGKATDDETRTDGTHIDETHIDETLAKPSLHEEKIQHMQLFNGLISFKKLSPGSVRSEELKGPNEVDKKIFRGDKELERLYKRAAKEATQVGKDGVEADNEHYKLGYGCLDRNRKRPWYLSKSFVEDETESNATHVDHSVSPQKKQKKTIAELREERLKREQQERARAQKILLTHHIGQPKSVESSDRKLRPYYNSSFGNAR